MLTHLFLIEYTDLLKPFESHRLRKPLDLELLELGHVLLSVTPAYNKINKIIERSQVSHCIYPTSTYP